MDALLSQLDETEREALVIKYLALQGSLPEPRLVQDGFLFTFDLVDGKGRLTDGGLVIARALEQSGNYAHLGAAQEPSPAEAPSHVELLAELHRLAQKVGGLAALRRLIDAEL